MSLSYTNLPLWIEKNSVFRALFLFRKLYMIKTKYSHYSQFAEDVSISGIFPKKTTGFFVDVGCFHPKKYSNTWFLYKKGWRGINIDIDSIKIDGFNMIRPQDTNINCAVSNTESGVINYYSNGFYSLTNSLDNAFVKGKEGYIKKQVKCEKLTYIIDKSKYKDMNIDFLSVDAEGHDLEVLESLDFDRYDPKLIAVETHKALFPEVIETPLYQLLISKKYCLVGWSGLTLLMANQSLQRVLSQRIL